MAYKLQFRISGPHSGVYYYVKSLEAYFNGCPINPFTTVEIGHGDTLRIKYSSLRIPCYYGKTGESESIISANSTHMNVTLPLADYTFRSQAHASDDFQRYSIDVTYTFGDSLYSTKPVYKRVNGGWRQQTAYEKTDGFWHKISTTDTISFTIDGVTWYARKGMTWSEWCNANDYSLNSWHIYGTRVAPLDDNSRYISGVTADTTITSYSYMTRGDTGGYDISVTQSGTSYRTLTPYSTNPTAITSGETVTLKFDWASETATPSAVTATNCEYTDSYTGTTSGVLTITLSNPTDDVVVNVHWEK